jgi:hypothetical protein
LPGRAGCEKNLPPLTVAAKKGRAGRMALSMNTVTDLADEIAVLRNELVRKDAIIAGLLATLQVLFLSMHYA